MTFKICIDMRSDNGLLHDGSNPLPDLMLINHKKTSLEIRAMIFSFVVILLEKYAIKAQTLEMVTKKKQSPRANELTEIPLF